MSAGASFSSCLPAIVLPFCTPRWVLIGPYGGYRLNPILVENARVKRDQLGDESYDNYLLMVMVYNGQGHPMDCTSMWCPCYYPPCGEG